jgi:hypothetical protein
VLTPRHGTSAARPLRARAFVLALVALAVALAGACQPTTSAAPQLPPLQIGLSFADTLPSLSSTELNSRLDDAAKLGVTTIRVDLDWNDVQHVAATSWDWAGFDRVVAAANTHNLRILALLTHSPAWARPAACTSFRCYPADITTFKTFVTAAANRYVSQGVHMWEIWNEPNMAAMSGQPANVSTYANVLRTAAAAIRAVDPQSTVISGGLGPVATVYGNIAQLEFVQQLCATGAFSSVDGVGYHPYSYPVPPSYPQNWNAWQQIQSTPTNILGLLQSCGATGKKIWLTEYGAPTNGPGVGATATNYMIGSSPDHVDEASQAQMATESVQLAAANANIASLIWYSYQDQGTSTTDRENFFGLRRFDGTTKPAYNSLMAAIQAYHKAH